jgi:hypothetical protein
VSVVVLQQRVSAVCEFSTANGRRPRQFENLRSRLFGHVLFL